MSKPPYQRHVPSTPDKRHLNVATRPPHEYQKPPIASPYQTHTAKQPPPFLFPDSRNYDPSTQATLPSCSVALHGGARAPGSNAGQCIAQEQPQQQRVKPGMPTGFDKIMNHSPGPAPAAAPTPAPAAPPAPTPAPPHQPPPSPARTSSASRYHLHIRQQPIAARACGAGDRDRRPVDPPPIIQMLVTDFNAGSEQDMEILKDPRFTVGCLLYPVAAAASASAAANPGLDSPEGPLLSGKAFVSPFHVLADPDPATAPGHHPVGGYCSPSHAQAPPQQQPAQPAYQPPNRPAAAAQPATFFIFSDLSIRSAGVYQLRFRLMNWGSVEDSGFAMPILAETWSDPFRVYPAKDFPGMRDSSVLAEGLKEAG
ncbi:Velvet factor, partial [Aspergillus sp. HF37]